MYSDLEKTLSSWLTVEGSFIGDLKCCMHNGVPRFVREVAILTEAYEKRL
jgi:hypothetical protein